MFETESQSYYDVLDVRPDASQAEIRQAYFRAKAAYGKDSAALYSLFDEQETRKVLDVIEQAFLVLSNPEKRKEYDKVHGFLKSSDELPSVKKTPGSGKGHTFSFGKGSVARQSSDAVDPAHAAAQAVFGSHETFGSASGTSESAPSSASASGASQISSMTSSAGESAQTRHRHEDYSTPRTLASTTSAGPPVEEYGPAPGFSARENRLGIVRRTDLAKNYNRNEEMEQQITAEAVFRGDFFRKVREYKGISIDELSEFTKISRTYLNCIESEEFESLPAAAYLRGFVLQFAKALKLPHEKAANAYMAHYKNTVLK
jgi:curved DNA-binding protein CbpA